LSLSMKTSFWEVECFFTYLRSSARSILRIIFVTGS
jgi:hypothetical protein